MSATLWHLAIDGIGATNRDRRKSRQKPDRSILGHKHTFPMEGEQYNSNVEKSCRHIDNHCIHQNPPDASLS